MHARTSIGIALRDAVGGSLYRTTFPGRRLIEFLKANWENDRRSLFNAAN